MRTLRRGSKGRDVQELQVLLKKLGYDPGPTDGVFGQRTEQAVIRFQKDNGLVQDGVIGPVTWRVLESKKQCYQIYIIQSGDTFKKIALKYKISLSSLLAANPGVDPNKLRIGQQIQVPTGESKPRLTRSVACWIPYWTQTQSFQSVQNHSDVFDSLSPFWYEVTSTGEVNKVSGAEDNAILAFARNQRMSIIPLITNNFSSELISTVLNDLALRQNHIFNIVNTVKQMNYDGIDINYENLLVKDKEIFVTFLQELKSAFTAIGKQLIVSVHAKTVEAGIWSGAEAHDYTGIGQTADIVRIMCYDCHWFGSGPGPIAPEYWVDAVLVYALSKMPKWKIVLGMPTYGYDWPQSQSGTGITYNTALVTAKKYNATIIRDARLGPHFSYSTNGVVHEVWFTDATSFSTLLDLVNKHDINGICIWYPGAEDPKIYDAIRAKLS